MTSPISPDLIPDVANPSLDLNGLVVRLSGQGAEQQAAALREAFPEANIVVEVPEYYSAAGAPAKHAFHQYLPTSMHGLLRPRTRTEIAVYFFAALALMIVGYWVFTYITLERVTLFASNVDLSPEIFYFLMAGFIAQMIDGALGMAYGVTATTFLTSVGISPVFATASVHSSEIFTSGVSGYMHLKFGNVNRRLFRAVLIPGVIGAALGAFAITALSEIDVIAKYLSPAISIYTAILGILILRKALASTNKKRRVRHIPALAWFGGFVDAIGGGGWGPIVNSTLIAAGRNPRYTIGSVNLAEFFVSLASSAVFAFYVGLGNYGTVILGLILGGMIAAPIAARLSQRLPVKTMMILVGIVVLLVSLRKIFMFFF